MEFRFPTLISKVEKRVMTRNKLLHRSILLLCKILFRTLSHCRRDKERTIADPRIYTLAPLSSYSFKIYSFLSVELNKNFDWRRTNPVQLLKFMCAGRPLFTMSTLPSSSTYPFTQPLSTMNVLPTVGISSYSELLKASAPGLFDFALYPPIDLRLFDVGTVFSFTAGGNICTQYSIVRVLSCIAE